MTAPSSRVLPEQREGVFVHAFKCRVCGVEFQVFSWLQDRDRVGEVFCPECGEQTPVLHWRTCFNEAREVGRQEEEWEIYRLTTRFPGFVLMDDSAVD
jgi:transcription elongation factor Elf1